MRRARVVVDEIELDLGRYELRRSGRRVKLEKKPMELLILLVRRRDQLVSRTDLAAQLWRSNPFVDLELNINNVVRKVRTALGDDAERPRFIETVVGKGYRFVGRVRVIEARTPPSGLDAGVTRTITMAHAGAHRDRSSLAALPLTFLGKPTDDSGISVGFADALAARLGNVPGLDVLPTAVVLNVPVGATVAETAARLGVRFVVHGAIQVSKGQWRLSMELFDADTQHACFTRQLDLDVSRLSKIENEMASEIAAALNRPFEPVVQRRPRYSKDPLAYAEFMRGFRLSASGQSSLLDEAFQHLSNSVMRDPAFSLGHAALSLACARRYFERDPAREWLEKAEFHCRRALELDRDVPEGHVARAFLLWGPSQNFQHLEAIAELKQAIALQNNQPQAFNRLGTIFAHIGLLDRAREMFERARPFHPKRAISQSIVQVHLWNQDYDLAREEIQARRAENPENIYMLFFAPQPAMMTGDWKEADRLLDEAVRLQPDEPLIVSLQGVFYAMTGKDKKALACLTAACATPKSFGHAHHSYYHFACILALAGRRRAAFEWLERSVSSGFACWPLFLKDPRLENLRELPAFEVLVSSLQARYPDHLGVL